MTLPFDPSQMVTLLLAAASAFAAFLNVKSKVRETSEDLAEHKTQCLADRVEHNRQMEAADAERKRTMAEAFSRIAHLELANAAHASTLAKIDDFKEALGEMRHEIKNQRSITMQLERMVARLDNSSKTNV